MEYIKGIVEREKSGYEEFLEKEEGDTACLEGAVHSLRDMGEIGFVILRSREGLLQAVWEEGVSREDLKEFHEGDCIRVTGTVKTEERAPQGKELRIKETEFLSKVDQPLPLPVGKWNLKTSLEAKLNMRPVSLRNVR